MCDSKEDKPPFGFRCPGCRDPLHRAVTVAMQTLNRNLRRLSDAEISGDADELDKYYGLFRTNIVRLKDRENARAEAKGVEPRPAPSRATEFTYENARDYTDNQLRSISAGLHFDPEAQDTIQETLERRYTESAYEAFGEDLQLDLEEDQYDDGDDPRVLVLMESARARNEDAHWGGNLFQDPPGADEFPDGSEPWEDSHIVYEVPELTDAEMFRSYLKAGSNKTPDEECRTAYEEWNLSQYDKAVEDCAGVLLNAAGKRKGIQSYDLFKGNAATAKKYASEELQAWWRANGRRSYQAFRYGYLGRDADRRSWELSRVEDFANVA